MTRGEAIAHLGEAGITGPDAKSLVDKFSEWALNSHLMDAKMLDTAGVLRVFGQDVGRAVLVLREKV